MIMNYLLPWLFSISAYLLAGTIARKAIIDGFRAVIYESPYQVSVQIHGRGHVCGGGIIDKRFILTAAHCILNRDRQLLKPHITVLAGTESLNKTGSPAVYVRVKTVFFPSEFHPTVAFSHGDIAVLRLVDSLPLEHHVTLKKLEFPRNYDFSRQGAEIAGFGWDVYNKGSGNSDGCLRIASTYVDTDDTCEQRYPPRAIQTDVHLCAQMRPQLSYFPRRRGFGVCTGDDGSPLVTNGIVIGILSRFAPYCNEQHNVAVYTRVVNYLRMIFNVMSVGRDADMISLHA